MPHVTCSNCQGQFRLRKVVERETTVPCPKCRHSITVSAMSPAKQLPSHAGSHPLRTGMIVGAGSVLALVLVVLLVASAYLQMVESDETTNTTVEGRLDFIFSEAGASQTLDTIVAITGFEAQWGDDPRYPQVRQRIVEAMLMFPTRYKLELRERIEAMAEADRARFAAGDYQLTDADPVGVAVLEVTSTWANAGVSFATSAQRSSQRQSQETLRQMFQPGGQQPPAPEAGGSGSGGGFFGSGITGQQTGTCRWCSRSAGVGALQALGGYCSMRCRNEATGSGGSGWR